MLYELQKEIRRELRRDGVTHKEVLKQYAHYLQPGKTKAGQ
jgi:hypothetical protein